MVHLSLWLGFGIVVCLFVCVAYLLVSVGGVFDASIDRQFNGNDVHNVLPSILNEEHHTLRRLFPHLSGNSHDRRIQRRAGR